MTQPHKSDSLPPAISEVFRRYWHGHLPYDPPRVGQTAEQRIMSLAFGLRPAKEQRRRYSGAYGPAGAIQ